MKKSLALATATLMLTSGAAYAGSGVVGGVSDVDAPVKDAEADSGWKIQLGLGAINAPTFPGVDDTETNGIPLINISYNDTFYLEWNKLGAWLWKPENSGFRLGLVAKSRKGYDRGDGPNPTAEVDDTGLAGVRVNWKSGKFALDGMFLGSSEEDSGGEVELKASYTFIASQTGTLTGIVKVEALSEDTVDYFWYDNNGAGESGTIASVGVLGTYRIAPKWNLIGAALASSYSDEISDAATEDSGTTALVGFTYTF